MLDSFRRLLPLLNVEDIRVHVILPHTGYSFGILMLDIFIWKSPVEDFSPLLCSHTCIEYFMSVFQHGYLCKLILYSPVEHFFRILFSHTHIEYLMFLFQHGYFLPLIL